MEATTRLDTRAQIRATVQPTIEAEGYRLIAVEISGDTTGDIVRLYCDGPSFGVDDCAKISRALSPVIDVEDPMSDEVSSPGGHPERDDFARTGYPVRLIPGAVRRRFTGTLQGMNDDQILIEVDGEQHSVPLNQLDWGHLVLDLEEFSRIQNAYDAEPKLEGAQS